MTKESNEEAQRKVLEKIQLTPEQGKIFQNLFGRPSESFEIVEFTPAETKRMFPGVLKAVGLHMECW